MFYKYLPIAALASGIVLIVGYQYRVELLDALCGTTPPATKVLIEEALDNNALILDVRMYVETRKEGANLIHQARNIPLLRLPWNLDGLPRDRTIITYCESGKRAGKAADMLNDRGFNAISGGGISNLQDILKETEE